MAGYILDTNVLSELMKQLPDPSVTDWFARQPSATFYTTVITQAEILLGIALLPAGKRCDTLTDAATAMFQEDFSGNSLPYDEACTGIYAAIVSSCRKSGYAITTEDAQIAAIALSRNLPLVTRNTRDFQNIDGLVLHNPWLAD